MLIVEKAGIQFVLVQSRFRSFKDMTPIVREAFKGMPGKPVVVVFPEIALGETPVSRNASKAWIAQVQRIAREHGNGHIFLSVLEHTSNKTVSNTGYLVGPNARNPKAARPVHWQAYPKVNITRLDKKIIGAQANQPGAMDHWIDRSRKRADSATNRHAEELTFSFPSAIINGKLVELRVCFDVGNLNPKPADIIVVPAKKLPVAREDLWRVNRSLRSKGFAIVNDVGREKRAFLIKRGGRIEPLRRK